MGHFHYVFDFNFLENLYKFCFNEAEIQNKNKKSFKNRIDYQFVIVYKFTTISNFQRTRNTSKFISEITLHKFNSWIISLSYPSFVKVKGSQRQKKKLYYMHLCYFINHRIHICIWLRTKNKILWFRLFFPFNQKHSY